MTEKKVKDSCLVSVPQLSLISPGLRHGLIKLNVQLEKIPLQWRVLTSEEPDSRVQATDTLAWAAVKAYDPAYVQRGQIQDLLSSNRHPFANLDFEVPRQTSTQLLCSTAPQSIRDRWSVECAGSVTPPSLLGKIVVIGSEQEPDSHVVLGARMWGVDLQARYIQALLSGRYLRAVPIWISFLVFAIFVFLIEGLPTLLEAYTPHLKEHRVLGHAFVKRRFVWVIVSSVALIFFTSAVSLLFGYLPPLAAFGDIFFLATTRLLIFTVESTEIHLVHPH